MNKELKIGILAVVVLAAAFLVINFLRDKDLFNRDYELVSFYGDVQGLLPSSPVYIKGFKAGTVYSVEYDKTKKGFDVTCSLSKDFAVPEDSRMTIYKYSKSRIFNIRNIQGLVFRWSFHVALLELQRIKHRTMILSFRLDLFRKVIGGSLDVAINVNICQIGTCKVVEFSPYNVGKRPDMLIDRGADSEG